MVSFRYDFSISLWQVLVDIFSRLSGLLGTTSPQSYPQDGEIMKSFHEDLGYYICHNLHPFSAVRDKGFVRIVRRLDPRVKIPSRSLLTNEIIPKACEREKNKLRWTTKSRSRTNYGLLVVHFATELRHLHSALHRSGFQDDTLLVTTSHASSEIRDLIRQTKENWNPTNKVKAIVTDNAANMVSAIDGVWRHVPCTEHILNFGVKSAIFEKVVVSKLVESCRNRYLFPSQQQSLSEVFRGLRNAA